MANEIIMTAAINFMASFLQAVTGFGYAVIAMSFMPFLLPFKSCSVISAFVIVVMGFQMTLMLRKHLGFTDYCRFIAGNSCERYFGACYFHRVLRLRTGMSVIMNKVFKKEGQRDERTKPTRIIAKG